MQKGIFRKVSHHIIPCTPFSFSSYLHCFIWFYQPALLFTVLLPDLSIFNGIPTVAYCRINELILLSFSHFCSIHFHCVVMYNIWTLIFHCHLFSVWCSSIQSLSRVQLFMTPWTATCQASLSITNSQSLLKHMSIELVMPSNRLILCRPLLLLPSVFPSIANLDTWKYLTSVLLLVSPVISWVNEVLIDFSRVTFKYRIPKVLCI